MLLLSPGNINDIAFAPALIAAAGPLKRLIADKAYDANSLRQLLADQCAKAVIPSTMSRRQPIPLQQDHLSSAQSDRTHLRAASRTSAGSQHATTSSRETSWPAH